MKNVVVVVALLAAAPVQAAGYYLGELTTRGLARGGAVIVDPQDPSAIWLNPAAITKSTGVQLNLNFELIFLSQTFVRDCGGVENGCGPIDVDRQYPGGDKHRYQVTADRDPPDGEFISPPDVGGLGKFNTKSDIDGHVVTNGALPQPSGQFFATFNLDSFGIDGFAVGAGFWAPEQGDYAFPADDVTRYTLIDINRIEAYYGIAAAYRFQNWIAAGITLEGVVAGAQQTIKLSADQYGNENPDFDITVDANVFNPFIPSAALGLWSNPLPGLELGFSVQGPRFVTASGPLTLKEFGPGVQELIDAELVTIDSQNPTALTSFTLAPFYRFGIKYGLNDLTFDGSHLIGFDVELDAVIEQWSVYDHVYLESSGLAFAFGDPTANPPKPLDPIVQPKDWDDSLSVRLGTTWNFLDEMFSVSTGGYYESSAIPDETYAVDLVDGNKFGVGVGGSAKLFGVRLDVGYGHVFVLDRQIGPNSIVHTENNAPASFETRTRIAMGKHTASFDLLSVSLNVALDDMFDFGVHAPSTTTIEKAPPPANIEPPIERTEPPPPANPPPAEEAPPADAPPTDAPPSPTPSTEPPAPAPTGPA